MTNAAALVDGNSILDAARAARLEMVNFRHDASTPGEVGALARLCHFQLPELAKRMGAQIEPGEGFPPSIVSSDKGLIDAIASSMQEARPMSEWLSSHISPGTAALFAKGSENSLQLPLDLLAEQGSFKRDDVLSAERGPEPGRPPMALVLRHLEDAIAR